MMQVLSREEDLIPYERDLIQEMLKMGGKNTLLFFSIKTGIFLKDDVWYV